MMNADSSFLLTTMDRRKSIREYTTDPISDEDLMLLLKASWCIPHAGGIRSLVAAVVPSNIDRHLLSSQESVHTAPVVLYIMATNYKEAKYRTRGVRYTLMEAGHTAQNICLMATVLGLGCVTIGAFMDRKLKHLLNVTGDILYLIPVGHIKK